MAQEQLSRIINCPRVTGLAQVRRVVPLPMVCWPRGLACLHWASSGGSQEVGDNQMPWSWEMESSGLCDLCLYGHRGLDTGSSWNLSEHTIHREDKRTACSPMWLYHDTYVLSTSTLPWTLLSWGQSQSLPDFYKTTEQQGGLTSSLPRDTLSTVHRFLMCGL